MAQQPQRSETITMLPGTYFVGDPCFAIGQDNWLTFLKSFPERNTASTMDGHKSTVFGAYGGDGERQDDSGNTYQVESGLIGAVPQALMTRTPPGLTEGYNSQMIRFDEPFDCWSELVSDGRGPTPTTARTSTSATSSSTPESNRPEDSPREDHTPDVRLHDHHHQSHRV